MSASTKSHRDTPTHPQHGKIIVEELTDGNATTIDCNDFLKLRCMVQIMNESATNPLYYKFCEASDEDIDDEDSVQLLPNEVTEKAFIPMYHRYLRVVGASGTIVRVWKASEIQY